MMNSARLPIKMEEIDESLKSVGLRGVCDRCGHQLLDGEEVVRVMHTELERMSADVARRWHAVKIGAAAYYAYGEADVARAVGRVDDVKKVAVEKGICACTQVENLTPVMRIIRAQHREFVVGKFGNEMALPLLFSLPEEYVAWENCDLVGVEFSDAGLRLTDGGISLVTVITFLSRKGYFDSPIRRLKPDDIYGSYSYLWVIKSPYRSYVAAKYGPRVQLSRFFSEVPHGLVDWQSLWTLKVTRGVSGDLRVCKSHGVSSFKFLAAMFGQAIVAQRTVVSDAAVAANSTCIQVVGKDFPVAEGLECNVNTPVHVVVEPGLSFLPLGRLVVTADKLALTFETGYDLVLTDGTCVYGADHPVSLFVDGVVAFTLRESNVHDLSDIPLVPPWKRNMRVGVDIDSYDDDTALGEWYNDRMCGIDCTSASIRRAYMIVINTVASARSVVSRPSVSQVATQFPVAGLPMRVTAVDDVSLGLGYVANTKGPGLLSVHVFDACYGALVNDVIAVADGTWIFVHDTVAVAVVRDGVGHKGDCDLAMKMRFVESEAGFDVLTANEVDFDGALNTSIPLYTSGFVFLEAVLDDESYVRDLRTLPMIWRIMKDPIDFARKHGMNANILTVLRYPLSCVRMDALEQIGFTATGSMLMAVELADQTFGWRELIGCARNWSVNLPKSSLGYYLMYKYPCSSGVVVCADSRCL